MPATAGDGAPPLWLSALAAVALIALTVHHVHRTRPQTGPDRGWPVTIEVVLFSVAADGALAYRVLTSHLSSGSDPDAAALAVSGLDHHPSTVGAVSHATSWRATPDPGVVLTYSAVPDPQPTGAVPLNEPSIVCSANPLRPAPGGLHAHHVAAHGARHLAYLAHTDPTVRRSAATSPEIWALLAKTAHAAVAPHDQAHDLAGRRPSPTRSAH